MIQNYRDTIIGIGIGIANSQFTIHNSKLTIQDSKWKKIKQKNININTIIRKSHPVSRTHDKIYLSSLLSPLLSSPLQLDTHHSSTSRPRSLGILNPYVE